MHSASINLATKSKNHEAIPRKCYTVSALDFRKSICPGNKTIIPSSELTSDYSKKRAPFLTELFHSLRPMNADARNQKNVNNKKYFHISFFKTLEIEENRLNEENGLNGRPLRFLPTDGLESEEGFVSTLTYS